ncbi:MULTISPECIES: hypothetical protein [Nostoc]|uniref:Uncharacterized protein n=1 Tax=Nostoc paludosum FACHB-159 TaxID=2692908 RepID=A0ABR8K8Q6_9NOSO|nr:MULTISPECIES: hypothetical protein [Nostoc]MBD2678467.1 hypothetical protein [Nostoc sp. FACHB-857]MBD2734512.1 hypothetical protein [Nostoc paludosum FACHB-159]
MGRRGDAGTQRDELITNAQCPMLNAQYFSTRGCANGCAQYKCPMPNAQRVNICPYYDPTNC